MKGEAKNSGGEGEWRVEGESGWRKRGKGEKGKEIDRQTGRKDVRERERERERERTPLTSVSSISVSKVDISTSVNICNSSVRFFIRSRKSCDTLSELLR